MSDISKTIVSFCVALLVSCILGLILSLLHPALVLTAIPIAIWALVTGLQKNGELENAIGGIFGQMTSWVIPAGVSWWIPKPFGQALRKTNVGKLEIDHTRSAGKQITKVETSDGVQVEASFYCLFEIVNLRTWVTLEDPLKALDAMMDRSVRWFVSYWPVSGQNGISTIKAPFSQYLMGDSNVHGPDGNPLSNDIREALERDYGVRMKSAKVDDINPPQSIVEANEAVAREDAELTRELKNMKSRMAQADLVRAKFPGLGDEEVSRMVLAIAGDIEVIDVRGGGDFSKGAAIGRSKHTPRKGMK